MRLRESRTVAACLVAFVGLSGSSAAQDQPWTEVAPTESQLQPVAALGELQGSRERWRAPQNEEAAFLAASTQPPAWLSLAPIIADALVSILGADAISTDQVRYLIEDAQRDLSDQFERLELRLQAVETRFEDMDARLSSIENNQTLIVELLRSRMAPDE